MIDIESELFDILSKKIEEKYPTSYITGEYLKSPPNFPCISIIEIDNNVLDRTRTTETIENHAQVLYEVNVYSNKANGKKQECKKIISLVDKELQKLGFTRTILSPVPNEDKNKSIYRIVARYRAIVSKNKTIYRR